MNRSLLAATLICLSLSSSASQDVHLARYSECDAGTRQIVDRVIAAFGGESRINAIQAVNTRSVLEEHTAEGTKKIEMEGIAVFPDQLAAFIRSTEGIFRFAVTPQSAHAFLPDSTTGMAVKLTDDERENLLRQFYIDPLLILRERGSRGVMFGVENEPSEKVDYLRVLAKGIEYRWVIDRTSGRLLRSEAGDLVMVFSDWKTVDGVTYASRTQRMKGGADAGSVTVNSYAINPQFDTRALFATPTTWLMRLEVQPQFRRNPFFGSQTLYTTPTTRTFSRPREYLAPPNHRVYVSHY